MSKLIQEVLNNKPLGVLCAMPEEVEQYLNHFEEVHSEEVSGVKFYRGTLGAVDVVLGQCGVGKVHAATASQTLILKYDVGAILFSGVAGALNPTLEVGDVVISSEAVQHDMDLEPLGFEPGQIPWTPWKIFEANSKFIESAETAVKSLGYNYQKGRVLSGDQFVADPERVKVLVEYFKGDCVEMEAGAVAQVCGLNGGVPWITLRAISDKADHSSPVDFPTFCKEAAVKSYEITKKMLEA